MENLSTSPISLDITEIFPAEITQQIFSYLNPRDLSIVAMVCRVWNQISSDDKLWEAHILGNIPHFPKSSDLSWKKHCILNLPGSEMKRIHVEGDITYSAWGNIIGVWRTPSSVFSHRFRCHYTKSTHQGTINCFELRHYGFCIAMITGSADKTIKVWSKAADSCSFQEILTLEKHQAPVTALKGVCNNFFSGDENGVLCLWVFSGIFPNCHFKQSFQAHKRKITCLQIASRNTPQTLFSGSTDRTIKVWRILRDGLSLIQSITGHNGSITSLEILQSERLLLSNSTDHTIKSWKEFPEQGFLNLCTINAHDCPIRTIHVDQQSGYLFSFGDDKIIKLWKKAEEDKWKWETVFKADADHSITCIKTTTRSRNEELRKVYFSTSSSFSLLSLYPPSPDKAIRFTIFTP